MVALREIINQKWGLKMISIVRCIETGEWMVYFHGLFAGRFKSRNDAENYRKSLFNRIN